MRIVTVGPWHGMGHGWRWHYHGCVGMVHGSMLHAMMSASFLRTRPLLAGLQARLQSVASSSYTYCKTIHGKQYAKTECMSISMRMLSMLAAPACLSLSSLSWPAYHMQDSVESVIIACCRIEKTCHQSSHIMHIHGSKSNKAYGMFVDCSTDFNWLNESQLTSPPRNSTPKPRCRNTEEWQREYGVLFDIPGKG